MCICVYVCMYIYIYISISLSLSLYIYIYIYYFIYVFMYLLYACICADLSRTCWPRTPSGGRWISRGSRTGTNGVNLLLSSQKCQGVPFSSICQKSIAFAAAPLVLTPLKAARGMAQHGEHGPAGYVKHNHSTRADTIN